MEAMADIMGRIFKEKLQARILGKEICESCGNEKTIMEKLHEGEWIKLDHCFKCEDKQNGKAAQDTYEKMQKRKAADHLKLYSTMNEDQQNANFENYDPENESQVQALKAARSLCNTIITANEKPKSILFSGSFGIGKSHIAAAACNELAKHAKSAAFVSLSQLKRKITSTFNNGSQVTADEIMHYLRTVDLLVIDDIGQHQQTEFMDETLQDLVESRQGKANIYTTNLSGRDLVEALNARVFERIKKDTLPIKVEGKSRRAFSLPEEWNF